MFNMLSLNPAYAGTREKVELTAVYRKQMAGIPGAPTTSTITADIPDNKNNLGFGLQLVDDRIGIMRTSSFSSSIAYRTHLFNSEDMLSLGLMGSITNFRANFNEVDLIQNYDPNFTGQIINEWLPNVGAGVYYSNKNFYLGLSAPSVLTNKVSGYTISVGVSAASNILIGHYYFTCGFITTLNDALKLKPSFLLKAVPGAPIQMDINANLWINDIVAAGISYRNNRAIVSMVEMQLTPTFRIGYSYDKEISDMAKYTGGSHELLLKYSIIDIMHRRQYQPRYF
jgi:type IX secretion system PorP/SprF family membrane protein